MKFDVKKYGAFGDGIHDDSAAIRTAAFAARQQAIASGLPQTVFFPKGTYGSPDLELGPNVSLEGETDAS